LKFKANLEAIKKSIESFVDSNKSKSRRQEGENIQKLLEGYEAMKVLLLLHVSIRFNHVINAGKIGLIQEADA
jgi:hypothetical protein